MMKTKNWFLFMSAVLACGSVHAKDSKKNSIKDIDVVLIQDDVSMGTQAPQGWSIQEAAAQEMGLCALYAKNKFNFDNSPAIIYARIADKSYSGDAGVEKLVQESAKMLREKSSKFKLETKEDFKSKKGPVFRVRDFLDGPSPNSFERIAYFPYKGHVFLAVYSSKTKKEFDENKGAFDDFLGRVSPYSSDMTALTGRCLYPKK